MTQAPGASRDTRFKPGNPGGGRPKKLLARVDEKLHQAGIHPVDELLKLYQVVPERDKVKIMLELLAYVAPKPREMIPLDEDDLGSMPLAELVKIIKTQLPELEKEAG